MSALLIGERLANLPSSFVGAAVDSEQMLILGEEGGSVIPAL